MSPAARPAGSGRGPSGAFSPRPGAAPLPRMVAAQAGLELRLLLRNGEQLLLTLVLPVLLLVVFASTDLVELGVPGRRVDFLAPGVFALAVMSAAFTGQAIATGYERRYGALKRLGATPLSRPALIAGKVGAVLGVEALQLLVLVLVAVGLGWRPAGTPLLAGVLIVLGTAAFTGLALLLAGTLRAEATLALANLLYVLLLLGGGVLVPLSRLPGPAQAVLAANPLAALAEGLRATLGAGGGLPVVPLLVLTGWAVLSCAAAAVTFRWE